MTRQEFLSTHHELFRILGAHYRHHRIERRFLNDHVDFSDLPSALELAEWIARSLPELSRLDCRLLECLHAAFERRPYYDDHIHRIIRLMAQHSSRLAAWPYVQELLAISESRETDDLPAVASRPAMQAGSPTSDDCLSRQDLAGCLISRFLLLALILMCALLFALLRNL